MKRRLVIGFIWGYLGLLTFGLGAHIMNWATARHPLMYFIVWDMFCGWSSYTSNVQLIAEGESEKFYQLSPGPWGELIPWGNLGRRHYDPLNNHMGRLAANTLRNSRHEPITRIYVIEECWPKKFDLPDYIWNMRYDEPKDIKKYTRLRSELTPDGKYARTYIGWLPYQNMQIVSNNPRLATEARKGKPLFVLEERPGRELSLPGGNMPGMRLNSPSGN